MSQNDFPAPPCVDVFLPSGSVSRAGRWVNSTAAPAPGPIHALAGGGPSRMRHDSLRHFPLHGQFLALGHGNIPVRVCFWGWVPGATSSSHRTSVSGFSGFRHQQASKAVATGVCTSKREKKHSNRPANRTPAVCVVLFPPHSCQLLGF